MNSTALKGFLRRELKASEKFWDGGATEKCLKKTLEWVERRLDLEQKAHVDRVAKAASEVLRIPLLGEYGEADCEGMGGFHYDRENGSESLPASHRTKGCMFFARRTGYCAANGGKCVHGQVTT